jgi:hypothetical protein
MCYSEHTSPTAEEFALGRLRGLKSATLQQGITAL